MVRRGLLTLIALGLILRIGYAVSLYEPSMLNYFWDDFTSYRNAAQDILQGDLTFSNSLYLKRPPLFALLVAALGIEPLLIITANILLGAALIPLTYVLARQLQLSRELALLAAGILAIDPTSIRYSSVLLAEPLANLLLACAFLSLVALRQAGKPRQIVIWGLLAGGCIVLSALTRPASYLFWIPMALWIFFAKRHWRIVAVLSLVAVSFLGTELWKQHNATYLRNGNFTTAGTFQLLYVRAASVLYQATGQDIDSIYATLASRVEEKLGNDVEGITANWRHRHLASRPEMQSVMTAIATDVFKQYPLYYLLTIPVGLYRTLLHISGWPVWLGIGWNIALLTAAGYGLWHLLSLRRVADAVFLFVPGIYFLAGTLLVATASIDTRARVMVSPLLAVLVAHAALRWVNRRKEASAAL